MQEGDERNPPFSFLSLKPFMRRVEMRLPLKESASTCHLSVGASVISQSNHHGPADKATDDKAA